MISAENDLKNQSPIVGKTYVCDRDMTRKERIVLKTAPATFVLLLFFFTQGAIVVITGMDGVPSALIRGAVIWGLVAITLAYSVIRYKGISKLRFRGAESGSIIPCVLLHALHDFCSFISGDGSAQFEVVLGAVQFIVLLAYFIYLLRVTARKSEREQAMKGR